METRYLGKERLAVPALGLGCAGFTDFYGKDFDETEVIATIHRSLEVGVNFFDVADVYGNGRNEELLGQVLRGRRSQVIIASKFGFVYEGGMRIDGRPEYIKTACDASLKRLGMDYIDLYYQHRVDASTPIEETVGAMANLVKAGKIRHIGLCEASATTLRRASAVHPITALQTEYSIWSRDVEDKIIPACRELGIGFIAYSPLGRGFFTGKVTSYNELAENDFRRFVPRFQDDNLKQNLELIAALDEIARDKECQKSQLALAWVLAQGQDIVPIPGTKRRKYLEENVKAVKVELTATDIQRINQLSAKVVGTRYSERGMRLTNL